MSLVYNLYLQLKKCSFEKDYVIGYDYIMDKLTIYVNRDTIIFWYNPTTSTYMVYHVSENVSTHSRYTNYIFDEQTKILEIFDGHCMNIRVQFL